MKRKEVEAWVQAVRNAQREEPGPTQG